MKKISVPFAVSAVLLLMYGGCYYDNEEALYPGLNSACDTVSVTFTGTIEPMLSSNCWSCHSDANAAFGGGVKMQSLADVKTNAVKALAAINHTGPKPMPPNGKLKPCQVTQFDIWIKKGLP